MKPFCKPSGLRFADFTLSIHNLGNDSLGTENIFEILLFKIVFLHEKPQSVGRRYCFKRRQGTLFITFHQIGEQIGKSILLR